MSDVQIQEEWTGFRSRIRKPVGWLWTAAWGQEGEQGIYMALWRRADGDYCSGQVLVGEKEAIRARFAAEVENKQKEGYEPLGHRSRRGLPRWKTKAGNAIEAARMASAFAANPMGQVWTLRHQLQRADGRAGVESLWGQYQLLRGRLEARVEYGEEAGKLRAEEALEALKGSMREALA